MLGMPKRSRFGLVDWRGDRPRRRADRRARRDHRAARRQCARGCPPPRTGSINICRALVRKARLIVMDEPTASLSASESERLFAIVRDLSASGVAVLYVSHRLDEILDLCDRVTVFRDGRSVARVRAARPDAPAPGRGDRRRRGRSSRPVRRAAARGEVVLARRGSGAAAARARRRASICIAARCSALAGSSAPGGASWCA